MEVPDNVYCEVCEKIQPAILNDPDETPGQDLMCAVCKFVIATFYEPHA